jgi:hypothetical protein
MTIIDSIVVIVCILTLGIIYTALYMHLYKEAIKILEAEKECCPSSEEDNE